MAGSEAAFATSRQTAIPSETRRLLLSSRRGERVPNQRSASPSSDREGDVGIQTSSHGRAIASMGCGGWSSSLVFPDERTHASQYTCMPCHTLRCSTLHWTNHTARVRELCSRSETPMPLVHRTDAPIQGGGGSEEEEEQEEMKHR